MGLLKITILPKWLANRARKKPCSTVVLHATAGSSLSGAIETLLRRGISYHYIIDKCGLVTKCAPYTRVAYHAGKSHGPDGPSVNSYSVGISFVNRNNGKDPYTEAQKTAAEELIKELVKATPSLKYLTTHRQISWPRKNDPVGFSSEAKKIAKSCGLRYWFKKEVPE